MRVELWFCFYIKGQARISFMLDYINKMRLLLTFTAADYIISLFVKEEIKS